MVKIPRYLKEYANAQKKSFAECELMQDCFKMLATNRINQIVRFVEYGHITIDEAMKLLIDPLKGIEEEV